MVVAGISSGSPCQCETPGRLLPLMATVARDAGLRAGLGDPRSNRYRLSGVSGLSLMLLFTEKKSKTLQKPHNQQGFFPPGNLKAVQRVP